MLTKLLWIAVILTPATALLYSAGDNWLFLAGLLWGIVIGIVSIVTRESPGLFMR